MYILVVDDDPLYRKLLTKMLSGWNYDVLTAQDGEEAIQILKEKDVRIVISDWMMPGINGPELCRRIREKIEQSTETIEKAGYHYVILLTANADDDSLVEGLSVGADDFIVKPFKPNELAARLRVGQRILTLEATLRKQIEEVQASQKKLEEARDQLDLDLRSAAIFQQSFLPHELPSSKVFHYAWSYQPCNTIGGDYLNIFPIGENYVGVVIIDVSGHGVQSALASIAISQEFRWLTSEENHAVDPTLPKEVALYLNEKYQISTETALYFTMFYGVLDLKRRTMQYISAGTPNPIHTRADGAVFSLEGYGMPVGAVLKPSFAHGEVKFWPDDRLFVYSDGVVEAFSPERSQWGEARCKERLAELHTASLDETIYQLEQSVTQWSGKRVLDDDLSIIGVECFADGAMHFAI
ncbi:MAG: SpoIIE family protein phosphatase [Planctomycetia bacterium]|jgi:sigma-B regulation protein RsbU (phosphoserine phosphatase)